MSLLLALSMAGLSAAAALDLSLGINLGNTLDAPIEGSWAPAAQPYYFDDWKTAGFKSVRIPIRWDNHTLTTAPYTINATFLDRVAEVVGWSLDRGFVTIINSHHDDWLDDPVNFPGQLPRFKAIWQQVSARFAAAPVSQLLFEAYNEPHLMTVDQLNTMLQTFWSTVRPTNPTRTLILGGLQWMNPAWIIANPDALIIPGNGTDPHLALEVHSYDPFEFTSPPISITEWGSAADVATVDTMFAGVDAWSTAHGGMPVILGEFSCSVEQTNETARLQWFSTFASAFRSSKSFAGAVIWDDDGWYKTYDRATRTWDEPVLQALGLWSAS